jgi:hypothetical protein
VALLTNVHISILGSNKHNCQAIQLPLVLALQAPNKQLAACYVKRSCSWGYRRIGCRAFVGKVVRHIRPISSLRSRSTQTTQRVRIVLVVASEPMGDLRAGLGSAVRRGGHSL